MPKGRHLPLSSAIRAGTGGQTRALLDLHRLSGTPTGRVRGCLGRPWARPRASRKPPVLHLGAVLHLRGRARPRTLNAVTVSLDAVCARTGDVARTPVVVDPDPRRCRLRARIDVTALFDQPQTEETDVPLRLRVVRDNASSDKTLEHPVQGRSSPEASIDTAKMLSLRRFTKDGA